MKVLDEDERQGVVDMLTDGELEIVYARIERDGIIYCTVKERKSNGNVGRTTDPAGIKPDDPRELFSK